MAEADVRGDGQRDGGPRVRPGPTTDRLDDQTWHPPTSAKFREFERIQPLCERRGWAWAVYMAPLGRGDGLTAVVLRAGDYVRHVDERLKDEYGRWRRRPTWADRLVLRVLHVRPWLRGALQDVVDQPLGVAVEAGLPPEEIAAAGALGGLRGTVGMARRARAGRSGDRCCRAARDVRAGCAQLRVSLVALALMRAVPPPLDAERPSLRRVAEGLRFAAGRPDLLGTYVVDLIAMFFGMPNALFTAIAAGLGGPAVLGLYAAPAAGAMVAFGTSGWTAWVHRQGWGVILAATAWGVAIAALRRTPSAGSSGCRSGTAGTPTHSAAGSLRLSCRAT